MAQNLVPHIVARIVRSWHISPLQAAVGVQGATDATLLLVPTGLRPHLRPVLIVSVKPDGLSGSALQLFPAARVGRVRPATLPSLSATSRIIQAVSGVDAEKVVVGLPLAEPTHTSRVAAAAVPVHLPMRPDTAQTVPFRRIMMSTIVIAHVHRAADMNTVIIDLVVRIGRVAQNVP